MPVQRNGKWLVDIYVKGHGRIRRQFDSEALAKRFELNPLAEELRVGSAFRRHYKLAWKGENDERNSLRITEELISLLGEDTPVTSLNYSMIMDMVEEWKEKENSNATINRKLSKLNTILTWCTEQGSHTSIKIPKFREEGGRIRFLTLEEEDLLLSQLSNLYHRTFFQFLVDTGCRAGEAMRLEWRDISNGKATFWETKDNGFRTIPIPTPALDALRSLPQGTGKVFAEGMTYIGFYKAWEAAKARVEMVRKDEVCPHVLRHTCATRLVQNKVDIRRVMAWLGHRNIKTTLRYAKLANEDLDLCAAVLSGIRGNPLPIVSMGSQIDTENSVEISTGRRGRVAEGGGLLNRR